MQWGTYMWVSVTGLKQLESTVLYFTSPAPIDSIETLHKPSLWIDHCEKTVIDLEPGLGGNLDKKFMLFALFCYAVLNHWEWAFEG